jgi:glycosyltransferase involved in cell wall biosynthesis
LRLAARLGAWLRNGRMDVLSSLDATFVQRSLRAVRARILHVHLGWLATTVLGARHDFGVPVVVSVYGSDVIRAATSRTRYLADLRSLLARGIPFVAESHFLKGILVDMGASPDRVFVVPVGIDLAEQPDVELTRQHRLSRRDARPIRILTIGRLVDYKAPQKLPAVAKILKDRGLNFEWSLVGEGPLLDEVRSGTQALGVADRFKLRGGIPFAELKDLLWSSDLMVHNAIVAPDGGRECLGVALIEAQAVGIPVVSCKVGGIPEAVADGQTGLLVEEGDQEAMADAIMRLAADPALRCDMALAGMRRARDRFDSAKLAAQLESVYDAICTPR